MHLKTTKIPTVTNVCQFLQEGKDTKGFLVLLCRVLLLVLLWFSHCQLFNGAWKFLIRQRTGVINKFVAFVDSKVSTHFAVLLPKQTYDLTTFNRF